MFDKLDHFSVNSSDPKKLARWYQHNLGLEIVMEILPNKNRKYVYYRGL